MAYDSLELNPEFTYETYQEQAPAVSSTSTPSGAAVTSLNGLGGPTVTLSGGTTGLSFSTAAPIITLTGTLAVASGGTGATTQAGARTGLGIDPVAALKSNLNASAAPTVNDDSGDGYGIGSLWIDTTADDIHMATDVTVGAAIWRKLN